MIMVMMIMLSYDINITADKRIFYVSGGHTTEVLRIMSSLSSMYYPRIYVVADTDKMSKEKIESFENESRKLDIEKEIKVICTC